MLIGEMFKFNLDYLNLDHLLLRIRLERHPKKLLIKKKWKR
jgi:hypothetical protein